MRQSGSSGVCAWRQHVERLLEISVVRQRAAIGGEQRLVLRIGERRLLQHGDRLRPLAVRAQRLAIVQRDGRILGVGLVALAQARRCRGGHRTEALASAFSPSDPVTSEVAVVWQPARREREHRGRGRDDHQSRQATSFERMMQHELSACVRLAGKSLQLNPKFGLIRPRFGPEIAELPLRLSARIRRRNSQPICHASRHCRGLPVEKIRVNSGGGTRCSATIFTPPSEMSVIMQSRGNRARAELNFRQTPADPPLASTPVRCQHVLLPTPTLHRYWVGFTADLLGYAEGDRSQLSDRFRMNFIRLVNYCTTSSFTLATPPLTMPSCSAAE